MADVTIKKLDGSEIEISGEIAADEVEKFRPQVLKDLGKEAEFPGFRKGHVPEKVLIEKIGEEKILLEMAQLALEETYPKIITEHKIDAIGRPVISITKIAAGNPLGFSIRTAIMPEIKLPDCKKIAKDIFGGKEETVSVEDAEVDNVINELRKMRATPAVAKSSSEAQPDSDGSSGEVKEEMVLPEVNDDFAKQLGDFSSVDDLRTKIKENILHDKEARAKEKLRLDAMDKIIDQAQMTVPKVLIESELHKMLAEMRGQIDQMGLKFEDYLKHLKKTEEDLMSGWNDQAEKRVKFGLVLNQIAHDEKISASPEEIEKETDHMLEHYPNVDKNRAKIYVAEMLTNEKVLQFLENQK